MKMNDFSDARLNCLPLLVFDLVAFDYEETINIYYEFFVANPLLLFIMMFCCVYAL